MRAWNPNMMTTKANRSWFCAGQKVEVREAVESERFRRPGKSVHHRLSKVSSETQKTSHCNKQTTKYILPMTSHSKNTSLLRPVLASLALVCAASLGQAQTAQDFIVNQFDNGTTGGWSPNYGSAPMTVEFDPNEDRGPGASPGALKCTINFDLCTYGGSNQRDFERSISPVLDLTKYTKLHFSVKVDTNSSHLSDWGAGAFGNLRPHIRLASWGGDSNLGSDGGGAQWVGTDAYGKWVDYTYNIDQTLANLATRQAMGVWGFDIWSGWGTCAAPIGHTNTVIFWLDNIWFEFNTNTAPTPPPTVGLEKAGAAGVQITMDDKTSQYQRNAISTPSGSGPYLWASQGSYPVTYSCTITNFPDIAKHPGFEAHMYLVNGDTSGTGNDVNGGTDWNSPDIFIFRIENVVNTVLTTNGTTITTNFTYNARAQIQWKTNYPGANATNIPVVVSPPSVIGTWSVTFTDPTNGNLSGPGITTTNFTLPEDAVLNNFSPSTSYLQFGMFKNDGANDGHNNDFHGTFSRVHFTGVAAPIDDDFSGATLTNKYAWRTTSATAVQHIPAGTAWIVAWTIPADGFNPQIAGALTGPWNPATFSRTYQSAGKIHGLLPKTALPSSNSAFIRLIKRPFVKLQVLMPGETAAPNTPTGKTGTPDPQPAGLQFNITVNSVDAFWNVVPSSDTVAITSTDSTATLPANATLVGGTKTFAVTFGTAGSWTVTATDVTDATKTANTGTATMAQ
jgi:hypothetical protein